MQVTTKSQSLTCNHFPRLRRWSGLGLRSADSDSRDSGSLRARACPRSPTVPLRHLKSSRDSVRAHWIAASPAAPRNDAVWRRGSWTTITQRPRPPDGIYSQLFLAGRSSRIPLRPADAGELDLNAGHSGQRRDRARPHQQIWDDVTQASRPRR